MNGAASSSLLLRWGRRCFLQRSPPPSSLLFQIHGPQRRYVVGLAEAASYASNHNRSLTATTSSSFGPIPLSSERRPQQPLQPQSPRRQWFATGGKPAGGKKKKSASGDSKKKKEKPKRRHTGEIKKAKKEQQMKMVAKKKAAAEAAVQKEQEELKKQAPDYVEPPPEQQQLLPEVYRMKKAPLPPPVPKKKKKKKEPPTAPEKSTTKMMKEKEESKMMKAVTSASPPKAAAATTTMTTDPAVAATTASVVGGDAPPPTTTTTTTTTAITPSDQHLQWVAFQNRISVEGFDTGQTTSVLKVGKKLRKKDKQTKMSDNQRRILERQRLTGTGGGEYPPLRYSEEETNALLAQAYAALPVRTGRRGGRNKKRQERRWRLVREIRDRQKTHIIAAHSRRMQQRSMKIKTVQEILTTAPPTVRRDREYQLSIYRRWAATMGLTQVPAPYVPPVSSPSSSSTSSP